MVRRAVAAAGALGALLVTAGCGGDGTPSSAPTPTPGPAEAYIEAVLGISADEAVPIAVRQEELVAACMAEQGFRYVPDVAGYHVADLAAIDPPPGTRGFAEQYGYGFAALPEGLRTTGDGPGANQEIVAAMSPEEAEAWERALWGDAVIDGDDDAELGGCMREARNEVWGDREQDRVRAALEDEIARIDAEVAPADPAVVEAAAAWAACMADAGHPGYRTPDDAEAAAWDRWLAFNDGIAAAVAAGDAGDGEGAVSEERLAADEAALATADWDCRAESDYDAVWAEVRGRLQQEYVDANREELDAWVERFASRGAG